MDIELVVRGITERNKREKVLKAAHALSERIGVNAEIKEWEKSYKYISREFVNGKWVYEYPKNNTERRVNTANQAKLITGVSPLLVNENNVYEAAEAELNKINEKIKAGCFCAALNKRKLAGMYTPHLYTKHGKPRPIEEIIKRVKLLPFILPIIEKYGLVSEVRNNTHGTYDYEIVGKADIKGKKYAVSVILTDVGETAGKDLLYLSVFRLKKKLIKSLSRGIGGQNYPMRFFDFSSPPQESRKRLYQDHNLIIPEIAAVSIVSYHYKKHKAIPS